MNPLTAILARDMRLAVRVGGGALMGALFFLIVITMMPFAVGPDLASGGRAHRQAILDRGTAEERFMVEEADRAAVQPTGGEAELGPVHRVV